MGILLPKKLQSFFIPFDIRDGKNRVKRKKGTSKLLKKRHLLWKHSAQNANRKYALRKKAHLREVFLMCYFFCSHQHGRK